jgi:hypothetical protein
LTFASAIAASVTITWTVAGTGVTPIVVASVSHRFAAPSAVRLTLALTAAGRRLFGAASGRLALTARAMFATSTGSVISAKELTFRHPPARKRR